MECQDLSLCRDDLKTSTRAQHIAGGIGDFHIQAAVVLVTEEPGKIDDFRTGVAHRFRRHGEAEISIFVTRHKGERRHHLVRDDAKVASGLRSVVRHQRRHVAVEHHHASRYRRDQVQCAAAGQIGGLDGTEEGADCYGLRWAITRELAILIY